MFLHLGALLLCTSDVDPFVFCDADDGDDKDMEVIYLLCRYRKLNGDVSRWDDQVQWW